jgi:hypothetical protein
MDKEKHMVGKIKLITSAITTYLVLSILTMITWIVLYPPKPVTALSFSLVGSSTWAIGAKGALSASQSASNAWTITNDSGGAESINWTVASSGSWTASSDGTQTVNDKFVLRKNNASDQIITSTSSALVTGLNNGNWTTFGLWFNTPKSGSQEGLHTLTITLTAVTYSPCGAGGYYNNYCWYGGSAGQSCTTVCSTHGGAISGITVSSSLAASVGEALWGSSWGANCDALGAIVPARYQMGYCGDYTVSCSCDSVGCWSEYCWQTNLAKDNYGYSYSATASNSCWTRACACNN